MTKTELQAQLDKLAFEAAELNDGNASSEYIQAYRHGYAMAMRAAANIDRVLTQE